MQLQEDIVPASVEDVLRLVEVWEASVRATHLFLTEADIQFFKPLVPDALVQVQTLVCARRARASRRLHRHGWC